MGLEYAKEKGCDFAVAVDEKGNAKASKTVIKEIRPSVNW